MFLGLCPACSDKLNYRVKKREIKRLSRSKIKKVKQRKCDEETPIAKEDEEAGPSRNADQVEKEDTLWAHPQETIEKTREEEFEEYLEDLLF